MLFGLVRVIPKFSPYNSNLDCCVLYSGQPEKTMTTQFLLRIGLRMAARVFGAAERLGQVERSDETGGKEVASDGKSKQYASWG